MTTIEDIITRFETLTEDELKKALDETKAELDKLRSVAARLPLIEELVKLMKEVDTIKTGVSSRIQALKEQVAQK